MEKKGEIIILEVTFEKTPVNMEKKGKIVFWEVTLWEALRNFRHVFLKLCLYVYKIHLLINFERFIGETSSNYDWIGNLS